MGGKSSKARVDTEQTDGASTIARAIARGRVFVSIRYPQDVANMEDASFTTEHFRHLLIQLQQKYPDFEVTLDAGPVNRYCEHAIFYNHTDKSKLTPRPRVLLEIFHSGTIAGIDKDKVKRMVQDTLDPNDCCYIDLRCEMGRYHTTPHLETLLRI